MVFKRMPLGFFIVKTHEQLVKAKRHLEEIGKKPNEIPDYYISRIGRGLSEDTLQDFHLDVADLFGKIGERTLPVAEKKLNHKNGYVRLVAAQAIGYIGKPAVPLLLKNLTHRNPSMVQSVLDSFYYLCRNHGSTDFQKYAPKVVKHGLRHWDEEVRIAAATALHHLANTEILSHLEKAYYKEQDPRVQSKMVQAVNSLRALRTAERIREKGVGKALKEMGGKKRVLEFLEDAFRKESSEGVKFEIANALDELYGHKRR